MRRICCCFGVISLHCAVQAALRQICVSSRSVLHGRQSLTPFCSCHSGSVTSERWSSLTSVCHFNYREVTQTGNYIKQVKFHCWVCRQILTLCFQQPSSRTWSVLCWTRGLMHASHTLLAQTQVWTCPSIYDSKWARFSSFCTLIASLWIQEKQGGYRSGDQSFVPVQLHLKPQWLNICLYGDYVSGWQLRGKTHCSYVAVC